MEARLDRRLFLGRLTRGTAAVAVLGIVSCSNGDDAKDAFSPRLPDTTGAGDRGSADTSGPTVAPTTAPTPTPATTTAPGADAVTVRRVSLGFVSAYVLARGGEAAVVDTGVAGSADQIEAGLTALGLGWGNVGHVVLTHLHGDHIGSITDVLTAAPDATGYAGAADIPSITAPRPLAAVGDGDRVFDLDIIETPGHTLGHISVYDQAGGILVAGDALNGADAIGGEAGTLAGANPRFTADIAMADNSIRKLAALRLVNSIYFGHGEPIIGAAGDQLVEFAASI